MGDVGLDVVGGDEDRSFFDPLDVFGGGAAAIATKLAEETAAASLAENKRQFDMGQTRLTPFLDIATPAIGRQAALAGSQGPEAQRLAFQNMQESPEIAYQRQQGTRQINSGSAATGGLGGGDRLRQLVEFEQGLGLQDLKNQFNRLGVVSGAGQTAGEQSAKLGAGFANQTAQTLANQQQGLTDAIAGKQQATSNAAGAGLGIAAMFMSDENLKTDIKDISPEECYNMVLETPMKAWKYLEEAGIDTDQHYGPMYQESPDCIKFEGKKALHVHDELWLIVGAMKYLAEKENGLSSNKS